MVWRKPIYWIGSTKDDLARFPLDVRAAIGYALHLAQIGTRHYRAKPLKGTLGGVDEIVIDGGDSDTYRAVYTVKLGEVVYALDAFKKKSTKGGNLPKHDRERIEARLKTARAAAREARG
jgi:phage-related protein